MSEPLEAVKILNAPYDASNWTADYTMSHVNAVIELGTASGNPSNFDKYVIQVFDNQVSTTDPISDIRIAPNGVDRAIINIRDLLQTQIERYKSVDNNLFGESDDYWIPAREWMSEWFLKVGSETAGTATINVTTPLSSIIPARDYERRLENTLPIDYITEVSLDTETADCTQIDRVGKPLTDWSYSVPASSITDGVPFEFVTNGLDVLVQEHPRGDYRSVSIVSKLQRDSINPPAAQVKGAEGYWILSYDASGTLLGYNFRANTIANGGGPNTGVYDGNAIGYPYTFTTMSIHDADIDPNATHYYIYPSVGTGSACGLQLETNVLTDPAWQPIRFNIREPRCNDYETINVRWMNSLGFWDYYTFTKKNEKRWSADRNEFSKSIFDYNTNLQTSADWRGRTVYSQKLVQEFTVSTDFLQDYEMEFLENMFFSPDIQYIDADGVQHAALITEKNIVEKTYRKDKLFQLEFTLQDAINLNSQRG